MILVITVLCFGFLLAWPVILKWCSHYEKLTYIQDEFRAIGVAITSTTLIIELIFMCTIYIISDEATASDRMRYESLTYQLENVDYESDIVGKKALYDDIEAWNKDLAFYKIAQRDLWIGVFIPNIYDQFNFIEYGG